MATFTSRKSQNGTVSHQVKIRIKGFPPVSQTFAKKSDAKRWAAQTETEIREKRYFREREADRHTLGDAITRYKESVLPGMPKVQRLFTAQLDWWSVRIGAMRLSDVTPQLLAECRDELALNGTGSGKPVKPATVNRYLASLSCALTSAVEDWGWLEDSPSRKVKRLKEPKGRDRYLTKDEINALLVACRNSTGMYLFEIVSLALATGARKNELLSLQWTDIDLATGRLTFRETKNGQTRSVTISGAPLDSLKAHRMRKNPVLSPLVFPSKRDPSKPLEIHSSWTKALAKAGIFDFRFHDLRHTAASYLAMTGASHLEIADVLGHKTLAMVKRYSHLSPSHQEVVIGKGIQSIFG